MRRRDQAALLTLALAIPLAAPACEGCEEVMIGGWRTPPIQPLFPGLRGDFDDALLEQHWQDAVRAKDFLPTGFRATEARSTRGDVVVRLDPRRAGYEDLDANDRKRIADALVPRLSTGPLLRRLTVHAQSQGGEWRPVVQLYPPSPSSSSSSSSSSSLRAAQAVRTQVRTQPPPANLPERPEARPVGALTGASIFLSPGHGWWHNGTSWTTQRSNSFGIVEDHSNAETVIQYLVPYLENAGARVYMARERDMQTNMVIVEAEDAIVESTNFGSGVAEGWELVDHPKARNGKQIRSSTINTPPTSTFYRPTTAAFVPDIPAAGHYAVYVWHTPPQTGRAAATLRVAVSHSGGVTKHEIDQHRDFSTWDYLGTYWFDAGRDGQTGSVIALNDAEEEGQTVSIDAVRFGGGMGDFVDGGTTSGKPRWEESGYYYTRFCGFDPAVTGPNRRFNQVHALPRWAEWEMEQSESGKSIYVAWHTNASLDHTVSGISSYIYSVWAWGPEEFFHGYPGSDVLARHAHGEILRDIRAGWDAKWEDVGIVGRWLGETNPSSNGVMPAVLLENGFHDNPHDAAYILEPEFRRLAAKAAYQGIVRYYANEVDGFDIETMLPEPPTHLRAQLDGNGATISWSPPPFDDGKGVLGDAATKYRVYRSPNGKGFDNGRRTRHTAMTFVDLKPGETAYFRVAAVNAGGESMPGETLCVSRPAEPAAKRVLLVNGFDRMDRGLNIVEDDGVERGIVARMNSRDYCIQHAEALAPYGLAVDSTSNEALARGDVHLGDYAMVAWMLGRESAKDATFDADERRIVAEYLGGGGALFVSGSDVAFDLSGTPEGTEFLRTWLKAEFVADDSAAREVAAPPMMLPLPLADRASGVYDARACDVVRAAGSHALLKWPGGGDAAVAYDGADFRVVYLAFPFECLDARGRQATMMAAMGRLLGE